MDMKNKSMKKRYDRLSATPLGLELSQTILTGSVQVTVIDVDSVAVRDLEEGFSGQSESDWTINFD